MSRASRRIERVLGLALILVSATISTDVSRAGIIRLERDGSGDFTILQDALDAAATGDTILIGPGRYDDLTVETFLSGGVGATIGNIHVDSLTIIGESMESVRIGPEEMVFQLDGIYPTYGLVADNDEEYSWSIHDLTIENCARVILTEGNVVAQGCQFLSEALFGVYLYNEGEAESVEFYRCRFGRSDPERRDRVEILGSPIGFGPTRVVVQDCVFDGVSMNISSVQELRLERVDLQWGYITLTLVSGLLKDVVADNPGRQTLGVDSSQITIENSVFRGGSGSVSAGFIASIVRAYSARFMTPYDAVSLANSSATIVVNGGLLEAQNCDFQPSLNGYSIYAGILEEDLSTLDLSDNYWGTTDSLAIEARIIDRMDPDAPEYPNGADLTRVQFSPWLDERPLPNDSTSFGGLKSRLRRGAAARKER